MGRLDLIDSISNSQVAVAAMEQVEREKEALRLEVASLSALKGRAEAKCEKLCADYGSMKTGIEGPLTVTPLKGPYSYTTHCCRR
jgi:hypothetical protein